MIKQIVGQDPRMSDGTSIFEQVWWYDAATDGKWQEAAYHEDGVMSAKLVFSVHRRQGLKTIGMPHLARTMEPVITFHSVRPKTDLHHLVRAISGLTAKLPKFDRFTYTLPPGSALDLAFGLASYTVGINHTFRTDPTSLRDPWADMDRKVRYNIRVGLRRTAVEVHQDIERYVALSSKFLRNRAFTDTTNYEAVRRIWRASWSRSQAAILACVDAKGHDLASAIVIWDHRHLYYWLSCRDITESDRTANSVLIWTAIEMARQRGLIFDMDGYSSLNAGNFLSHFGLIPSRRYQVSMVNTKAVLTEAFTSQIREVVGPQLRQRLLTARSSLTGRRRPSQGTFAIATNPTGK